MRVSMSIIDTAARKVRTLRREISAKGVARVARITVDRAAVYALSKIFNFPASWHPPTSARPYRVQVAGIVNALQPHTVCEVGCGLGSVLKRVKANNRVGYDISPGVVRAARLVTAGRISMRTGTLEDVTLLRMDVLILFNWIHEISPHELARQLAPLLPRTTYLVLDAINPDNQHGYRYKHDFEFLQPWCDLIQRTPVINEGRSVYVYKVRA